LNVIATHGPPLMPTPPPDDGGGRYERIYRESGTAILGYSLRRCAFREDALDVVAETFATAWRRRDELPEDAAEARAWLFGIARNFLANADRSSSRASRLGERLAASLVDESVPDPAVVFERSAQLRRIRTALQSLSEDDRELLTLIAWEGLTPAQAATALGLATGTARVRLHRARTRLRAILSDSTSPEGTDHDH
jgi:RNA polymerase sigma-70 factor (ECF subfamily)